MDYNRALNAAYLGWALALIALLLNVASWLVVADGATGIHLAGIVCAVLTLACSYFSESLTVQAFAAESYKEATDLLFVARKLYNGTVVFCAASYFAWLAAAA